MSDNDWFDSPNWHDAHEAVDPGGAAAGPGAIGPVPAQLISSTSSPRRLPLRNRRRRHVALRAQRGPPAIQVARLPALGASGGLAPISNATTEGGPASTPGRRLWGRRSSSITRSWRSSPRNTTSTPLSWPSGPPETPDFAERYLATHGKVNFGTYLKIKEFMASKQIAGAAFAEHNTQTSNALRFSIASTKAQEEANARAIDATRMV